MILHAWLAAWLMVTGASVGAIAWQAIHRLTGGAWGDILAARWRTLRLLLPVAALAAVPLLIDAPHLFPWINEPVEASRDWYLDYAFLVWRTAGCFIAWAVAWRFVIRAPAASLIVWLFACGVFANDWIVSLTPAWRSSVMGLVVALGQLLLALAVALLMRARRESPDVSPTTHGDQGSLLFAASLGWAYLVGIDYLTAWMADLPSETIWYLPRTQTPWAALAVAAIVLQLVVPTVLLLSRTAKTRLPVLRTAAASVLLGQACHVAWMVMP
ncbi:hypothetical protein ACQKIE_11725 [Luteibacter sp. NPDC031894]|uniref:hypothetical protein n=1 Tax=Luteibacter sp. NPDC031894 TaxID=3390572 RepID=UPI003D069698